MACGPLSIEGRRPYGRPMHDILALPTGPVVDASLALVRSTESQPIVDHSIRSFLFARLVAEQEGCLDDSAYDEELLFAAAVMHDLGLGDHAEGQARFEVEGADLAASLLRSHGVAEPDIDRVWEAIALHSSHGIADRRGLLTYLTYKGVFVDVGHLADAIEERLRDEVLSALRNLRGTTRSSRPSWSTALDRKPRHLQARSLPTCSLFNNSKGNPPADLGHGHRSVRSRRGRAGDDPLGTRLVVTGLPDEHAADADGRARAPRRRVVEHGRRPGPVRGRGRANRRRHVHERRARRRTGRDQARRRGPRRGRGRPHPPRRARAGVRDARRRAPRAARVPRLGHGRLGAQGSARRVLQRPRRRCRRTPLRVVRAVPTRTSS